MALKTSRLPFASFDKRSVLLFAALSLGAVAALHAQKATAGTAPSASTSHASKAAFGPAAPSLSAEQDTANKAAFAKADANRDGQLSAQEAATLPAIGNRFQKLDTDKNGMLSSKEFLQGSKP